MSRLLEFRNVTVIKGDNKKVLDSFSIAVDEGENIAILGPNGAGKSSLIKTITRQYYPVQGRSGYVFRIWGQERWNIFDLRSLLGIVSNDLQYVFMQDMTGFETVISGFFSSVGLYHERVTAGMKKKAIEVIDFLELSHLKEARMDQVSSGEARRFLIGRALVHDPRALILDEPSNSLDLHGLYKFSHILRKITRSGVSIILVTQNLHDIIPEINRVVLMRNGKLLEDGPKDRVLNEKNISRLFRVPVEIKKKDGYYYALRVAC
jgi:iron complex transport system ATP-binding protein